MHYCRIQRASLTGLSLLSCSVCLSPSFTSAEHSFILLTDLLTTHAPESEMRQVCTVLNKSLSSQSDSAIVRAFSNTFQASRTQHVIAALQAVLLRLLLDSPHAIHNLLAFSSVSLHCLLAQFRALDQGWVAVLVIRYWVKSYSIANLLIAPEPLNFTFHRSSSVVVKCIRYLSSPKFDPQIHQFLRQFVFAWFIVASDQRRSYMVLNHCNLYGHGCWSSFVRRVLKIIKHAPFAALM